MTALDFLPNSACQTHRRDHAAITRADGVIIIPPEAGIEKPGLR